MMAQTEEDLNENIERLYEAIKRHGPKVQVEGVQLKQARETVYLGVRLHEREWWNGERVGAEDWHVQRARHR